VLVAAPGALAEPRLPALPGLDRFEGHVFHSARWNEDVNLDGQRVAVVGTGASAIQIVPAIQPVVERLVLFQRTPPWVIARHDRALSGRLTQWLERVPVTRRALRSAIYGLRELMGLGFRHPRLARVTELAARRHLRRQVSDPDLRKKLTPDYTIGCKRILLSDDYYPALTQPSVEVVDGGAVEVRRTGIVGANGAERPVDVIVFSTGFHVTDFPFAGLVDGSDGRSLAEVWGPSPTAHLGTTVAGFPNLFILQGPYTGLGHSSVVLMIEAQIEHVIGALRLMNQQGIAAVEPRQEAQARFVREVDAMMEGTVWTTGGCRSWYLDETGRNSTLWPGSVGSFRRRVEAFRPDEYRLRPAAPVFTPRETAAGV
jgi:cation diffusion facilitator CzcD-associated flavoprotein CzcO